MAKELSKDYASYFIKSDISNEVTIFFFNKVTVLILN